MFRPRFSARSTTSPTSRCRGCCTAACSARRSRGRCRSPSTKARCATFLASGSCMRRGSSVSSPSANGTRRRRPSGSRSRGPKRHRPFPRWRHSTITSVPHRSSSARCRSRTARSTWLSPERRGSSKPNTSGRSSRTPAWVPACAVVDARLDGATLWTGSQKPHFARDGVARVLGLPQDKVHGIWVPGPGSYGRNDAGDAGIDAALLSKALRRPVRVQGMRYEGHGWDPKGPASIHRARAAVDLDGAVIGYVFESKGFSRVDIDTNESDPAYSLAGQLMGLPLKSLQGFGVPAESYGFTNKRLAWETIAPLLDRASPLRTAHLRDPVGPQIQFASESFID